MVFESPYVYVCHKHSIWCVLLKMKRFKDFCHFLQQITFPCGKEHKIINVTEPSTCNYHMVFETPYVCHKHSMLVYPTLDKALQTEWGYLEGELARREITEKVGR